MLYDGHTTDSKVLGRFCGSKVPHPVGATSDKMLMVFKSDASVQRRGFSAKHMSGGSFHFFRKKDVRYNDIVSLLCLLKLLSMSDIDI